MKCGFQAGYILLPGTPFVSYFFRQLETPKTSNSCLKNRAQTAFQVVQILCEKTPRFGELKVYVIPANSSKRRW